MESKVYGNTMINVQNKNEHNFEQVIFDLNEPKPNDENLNQFIDEKDPLIQPAKITANLFKNKVARVNENFITTDDNVSVKNKEKYSRKANIETNVFSFNVKKLKTSNDQLEKGKLSDKQITSDLKTSKIENSLEQINNLINQGKNTNYCVSNLNVKITDMLTITDFTLENNKILTKVNYNKINEIVKKIDIGRVNKINNNDLIKVMQFFNLLALHSHKLGLKKQDFQSLGSTLNKLLAARKNLKGKRDEYLKLVHISEKNLETLVKIISDPTLKIGPDFVKMLSSIIDGYSTWTNKVNLNDLSKAISVKGLLKSVSGFRRSVKDLDTGEKNIKEAETKLKLLNLKIIKILGSDSFNNSWEHLAEEPDLIEDVLQEIINDIIASADRLGAEMDLSVEAGPADMIELFQSFRKIIVQLDLDLRLLNKMQNEKTNIDEQYLKSLFDNKARQEKLTKTRMENLQEMEMFHNKQINQLSKI